MGMCEHPSAQYCRMGFRCRLENIVYPLLRERVVRGTLGLGRYRSGSIRASMCQGAKDGLISDLKVRSVVFGMIKLRRFWVGN